MGQRLGGVRSVPEFRSEIRRVICLTNATKSVNARIRRAVKARGHFPQRAGRVEVRLPHGHEPGPTGTGRKPALNALDTAFDGRLAAGRK